MKCKRCGKELRENEMFCTNCGLKRADDICQCNEEENPVTETDKVKSSTEAIPQTNNKKNKVNKKCFAIGGIIVAVIIMIVYFSVFKKPTINLNQYAFLSLKGSNGYASASFYFDYEGLIKDYGNKLNEVNYSGMSDEEYEEFWGEDAYTVTLEDQLHELIECDLQYDEKLSNGDKVTFVWDIDELEKIILKKRLAAK